MKKKLLATAVAVAVGGAVLGGVTQAADITESVENGIPTLTVCDENNSNHCITLMDRNLGATTNDISSTGSYGNHYQWGNNYGFSPFEEVTTGDTQIDCSMYSPLAPFSGSTFIVQNNDYFRTDYCLEYNNDLWGNTTNTPEARQGPCPSGFHVPSKQEWKSLVNIWAGTDVDGGLYDNDEVLDFQADLRIPSAGYRDDYDGTVYGFGEYASLWSSSLSRDMYEYAGTFVIETLSSADMNYYDRATARSVRCFKDTPPRITQSIDNGISTLTICDENDSNRCITMMDRNLGATTNDISSTGSYGNYYQWGNNHGFGAFETVIRSYDQIDCSSYNPLNPFNSTIFFNGGNYCIEPNNNLWGGATNTYEAMQGPCPIGYHIPKIREWNNLLSIWAGGESAPGASTYIDGYEFKNDFKIPFAGYREGSYADLLDDDYNTRLWTSYSEDGDYASCFYLEDGMAQIEYGSQIIDAYPIRCFKNPVSRVKEVTVDEIPTLTICDDNDSSHCITMMDRNLGATTNDIASTGSYGNHYQWGNNYGFSLFDEVTIGYDQIDCSMYNPLTPFSGSTFIIGYENYCLEPNDNLWGDTTDTLEARQGPCPDEYHVPSRGEWSDLLNIFAGKDVEGYLEQGYMTDEIGLSLSEFKGSFRIPNASNRDGDYVNFGYDFEFSLWSSSPYSDSGNVFSTEMGDFNFFPGNTIAYPVRCFKNEPVDLSSIKSTGNVELYVQLSISGGNITIGIDTGAGGTLTKNLGTIGVSNDIQVISGAFGANALWVEDMKGNESGYYTTLSVSDMVGDINPTHIISKSNIQLRPSGVTRISGAEAADSKVVLGSSWNDWTNNSWEGNESTVTYFNRQNTSLEEAGRVGRWGDNLQIKVSVPAHTVEDVYRGVVTYTLYEL